MSPQQPRIFFFSSPRTGCHFLERMLQAQPNTLYERHLDFDGLPYLYNLYGNSPVTGYVESEHKALVDIWAKAYDQLLELMDRADIEGKRLFYHDHTRWLVNPAKVSAYIYNSLPTNTDISSWITHSSLRPHDDGHSSPMMYPDTFSLNPRHKYIINIRHPITHVPSFYHATINLMKTKMTRGMQVYNLTQHWQRALYEWLIANGQDAFVIDHDDYVVANETGDVQASPALLKLCQQVGLDPEAVQVKWPKTSEEEVEKLDPIVKVFTTDLNESEGAKLPKLKGVDAVYEDEKRKWLKEFGEDATGDVERMVKEAMGDYEWLWERRVQ